MTMRLLLTSATLKEASTWFDFSDLERGIYMVRITSDKGIVTRKIVKD